MSTTNLKKTADFSGENFYIGLDVHKKVWSVTVRTSNLEVAHFSQLPDPKVLLSYLNKRFPSGSYYSAYEAGFSGTSAHVALCALGIENIIVHAADIPNTDKERKNKTDFHDSRAIAKYLEKGLLRPIHVLAPEQQEIRAFYRLREVEVRNTTRAMNRLKGYIYFHGVKLPDDRFADRKGFPNRVLNWLDALQLNTSAGTTCLQQYILDLRDQRSKVFLVTRQLRKYVSVAFADSYRNLLTIPGIGPITATALLTEIGDFSRFDNPKEYCSYLGLIPWEHSSGEIIRTQGAQPRCNKHLRPMLIEASWIAIRKDSGLLLYYKRHAAANNKHAIMKVARKLALIARGVVLKNKPYDGDYVAVKQKQAQPPHEIKQDNKTVFKA